VKILFDTNVLTAAFVPQHPNHGVCRPWFQRAKLGELQGYVSLHTVAELYSVLTKLPLAEKITPIAAQGIILPSLEGFVKVRLDLADYVAAIEVVTQYGLVSGAVFDALIAQAGLKVGVDRILTFNVRDFERLGDEVRGLIEVPGSPDMP
jgi:predicted nucleic acid-binding protein